MTDLKRKLMQHHDGELDAITSEQLAHRLVWDGKGRSYLAELRTIGDSVRDAAERSTPMLDLTDAIMDRIDGDQVNRPAGLGRWSRRIGVGLGSTAALAAAALFWVANGPEPPPLTAGSTTHGMTPLSAEAGPGAAIESVDFGGGGGSIFMVQAGQDTTPVVWLTDPHEEARGEPL